MPDDRRSTALSGRPTLFSTLLDGAERYLETHVARLVLSALILLSLLPVEHLLQSTFGVRPGVFHEGALDLVFFCVFAPEFTVRLGIHRRRRRLGDHRRGEASLLVLDALATLSFLPVWGFMSLSALRLVRLLRMVLLLGYWGGMLGDLLRVLWRRERRFQVVFVALLGVVLSISGAILIHETNRGVDASGEVVAGEGRFPDALWWAFRQVQDPGNLVGSPDDLAVTVISLILTFAGLLLFSFLVGIGTGAIDDLLARSRMRPVGLRDHTVVLGLGRHTHFLLTEFAELYSKNHRRFRAAVLGLGDDPARALGDELVARYRYRQGSAVEASDLTRVDITRAKRVIIVGTDDTDPDAEVVSAILATRDRNPTVHLYPDLDHAANLDAARAAGGRRTHVIGSGSFLGAYVAQNVIHPGTYRLYRQLLTASGCEIYTYLFPHAEHVAFADSGPPLEPRALLERAFREHGVTAIGVFVADPASGRVEVEDFEVLLHPTHPARPCGALTDDGRIRRAWVRGLIGISLRWEDLRRAALAMGKAPKFVPPVPPPPTHGLALGLAAPRARRVLVCGGSPRVPRVVTELIRFYGPLTVTVLVRDSARLEPLTHELVATLDRALPGWCRDDPSPTLDGATATFVITLASGVATIHVVPADWSDTTQVARSAHVDLERTDVVLFLPSRSAAHDSDGLVALDCLKLARLRSDRSGELPAGFRVVGLMDDPVKGDLLENRLDAMTADRPETTFTIV